jgi:hypothetical protein
MSSSAATTPGASPTPRGARRDLAVRAAVAGDDLARAQRRRAGGGDAGRQARRRREVRQVRPRDVGRPREVGVDGRALHREVVSTEQTRGLVRRTRCTRRAGAARCSRRRRARARRRAPRAPPKRAPRARPRPARAPCRRPPPATGRRATPPSRRHWPRRRPPGDRVVMDAHRRCVGVETEARRMRTEGMHGRWRSTRSPGERSVERTHFRAPARVLARPSEASPCVRRRPSRDRPLSGPESCQCPPSPS